MVSFTTASTHTLVSLHSFLAHFCSHIPPPNCLCIINTRRGVRKIGNSSSLSLNIGHSFVELLEVNKRRRDSCCSCWCKAGWDSEEDSALEADILEFMKTSEKPDTFPSKKELLDAGRMDLVEAIQSQGGWLALGWDLDDDNREEQEKAYVFQEYRNLMITEEISENGPIEKSVDYEVGSSDTSSLSHSSSSGSLSVRSL